MILEDYVFYHLSMIDFLYRYSYPANEIHDQILLFLLNSPHHHSNVIFIFTNLLFFSLTEVNQIQDMLNLGISNQLIYRLEY